MDRQQLHNLPDELKKCNRWVVWALEDSITKEGKERKRCKVPKNPRNHKQNASSTDPKTWSDFDFVINCELPPSTYQEENNNGTGLTFGMPYFGVDVDKCRNPETGEVEQWAKDLFAKLPATYTELSPSLKGFHLWYRCADWAKLPDGHRTERVEVYSRGRYFTMTGLRAGDHDITELALADAIKIFDLVQSYREKKSAPTQARSEKLDNLMSSIDFPDLSAAVQSLLVILSIETICDREQVEARFKQSKLYNDTHWKTKWDRLKEDELEKAFAHAREHIAKRRTAKRQYDEAPQLDWAFKLGSFDTVETEVLNWLWEGKVPLGNVTIFAGDPGQGKSLMALDLACRGSVGATFLDGTNCGGEFETLLLSDEDHRTAIIKPRMLVAGANVSKIHYIDQVIGRDDLGAVKETRQVDLLADLERIRVLLTEHPAIKLVIIDPLSNYMGEKSLFRDQEMRQVLMPINTLAQDTGTAFITIMHNSKQTGRTALAKIGASLGGVGVVRIAWSFVQKDESTRLMLIAKKNLGDFPGIEYTTEGVKLMIGETKTEQARMKFVKVSKMSIENVLTSQEDQDERKTKPGSLLLEELFYKPGIELPVKDIYAIAKERGVSERTLRRACNEMGLLIKSKGKQGSFWERKVEDGKPKGEDSNNGDSGFKF